MKNTPLSILACVCLILSAFLCGLYLGRGIDRSDIRTEALFTEPVTSTVSGIPTEAPASTTPSATTSTTPSVSGKVNINTADLATLMTLEGIGEVIGQRIIDYRNEHGPFQTIAEITNVQGIGEKRFEAIMDDITVGG